jgi:imidazole glycerol-phosphate synthase subunit HisF
MDGDGTLAGYDLEFTRGVADAVTLPVVASGGAGTLEHFYQAVVEGHASVVLAASVFHFRKFSIAAVKDYLKSRGVEVAS